MSGRQKLLILVLSVLITWGGWKALNALFFPKSTFFRSWHEETKMRRVNKSKEEWKKTFSPEQFRVMFEKGTEPAWSGLYNDFWEKGAYLCAACGSALFLSEDKYDHGTGWPSFKATFSEANVEYENDYSAGMSRIEVRCSNCGAHLGHLFFDGPPPTGRHYCINSVALKFLPQTDAQDSLPERATFAAGCFWGVEYKFSQLAGVLATAAGFAGGHKKDPTYEQVCSGKTGHAETVEIVYDPKKITYEELVRKFFSFYDPTQLNRQGPDVGSQYRSAIFYRTDAQRQVAQRIKEEVERNGLYGSQRIVTEIVPLEAFYRAEEYHQQYYLRNKK